MDTIKGYGRKGESMARKVANEKDAVRWVSEKLGEAKAKKSDAPSSMAWALYSDVVDGNLKRDEFWSLWARLLPTKTQLEREAEVESDQDKLEDLINETLRKVSATEDIGVEPTAPQEDYAAWGFKRGGSEETKGAL